MRLPMLRETRMPAVLCILGPVRVAIDAGPAIASAVVEAARTVGLTVYLRVYPQACPPGVCNPQLDTSMTIPSLQ